MIEPKVRLLKGDCLDKMWSIPDGSIDMILCDLPYGTTNCKWDTVIPFDPLWAHYERLIKPNGAIVLFSGQPFTTCLIASNLKSFKYEWIYEKTNPKGFLNAKRRPLTAHENITVFSFGSPPYYPQRWSIPEYLRTRRKHMTAKTAGECYGARNLKRYEDDGSRYPTSVIGFSNRVDREANYHPTQKPVPLLEYLLRTYTNTNETVLDNCMGSGSTGVAAVRTERHFIGIEKDEHYFGSAVERIREEKAELLRRIS